MLAKDELTQIRWRGEEQKESHSERRQRSLQQEEQSNLITVAPDAGRDVTNPLAQYGQMLSSQEVQRRLKLCNSRLSFEVSLRYPELTGIYIITSERDLATGGWKQTKKHIMGMESGLMPEFTIVHKAKKKIANKELFGKDAPTREITWKYVDTYAGETRGWRTVLARLLRAGLITQGDIDKHFPLPSKDSEKWQTLTT